MNNTTNKFQVETVSLFTFGQEGSAYIGMETTSVTCPPTTTTTSPPTTSTTCPTG
jgi:hypothetical protein